MKLWRKSVEGKVLYQVAETNPGRGWVNASRDMLSLDQMNKMRQNPGVIYRASTGYKLIKTASSLTKAIFHQAVGALVCAGRLDLAKEMALSYPKKGKEYKYSWKRGTGDNVEYRRTKENKPPAGSGWKAMPKKVKKTPYKMSRDEQNLQHFSR